MEKIVITSVIPKVSYDIRSNSFVGFTLPLKNGLPSCRFFSTNSLFKLETWHNEVDKSSLLNTHVIQAICPVALFPPPPPFLLSTYGTNGKYTAKDVLSRWITAFDLCMGQNIGILGFTSDCDSQNLKAM